VDWTHAGGAFGWEKATEGTGYVNPWWPAAKIALQARAKADGFVPGAYLFLRESNAEAQADHFAATCGDLTGFAIAVDVEPTGTSRPRPLDAAAAVARLRVHYPAHPIGGYIPQWYWGTQETTFVDYLWASHYLMMTGTPDQMYPHVPGSWWGGYGGLSPALLQFSSHATVAGIPGLVDVSAYQGTQVKLRQLVTGVKPAPISWEDAMMQKLPSIREGATGAHVWTVQNLINARTEKELLKPSGSFDKRTDEAVRGLQHRHGLRVDGVVGPRTWEALITGTP
jgi:peptidoglycan hydrolase-like protein with peptidoglycan-binding domain